MVEGTCHLCLQVGLLSYEHVPPEAAFNGQKIVQANMDLWLREGPAWNGRRGKQLQRGSGAHTLCVACNSVRCSPYAKEYVALARRAFEFLDLVPEGAPPFLATFSQIRPLRFLKQALAMFLSVNPLQFAETHRELRHFVLNKEARHLPNRYEVYLTLVRRGLARHSGLSAGIDVATGKAELVTEVAHVPFALALTVDSPRVDDLGRISHFGESRYDDRRDVHVRLLVGEVNTPYPGDFRRRAELEAILDEVTSPRRS